MVTFIGAFRAERQAVVRRPRAPRTPLAVRAGQFAARMLPSWPAVRTAVLSTSGLGLLTAAAWQLHLVAGLAAAGVSLLVLEALSSGERR